MEADEREHQAFEILHQIIEKTQAFRVLWLVDIQERTDLRCCERDVLISNEDFEFLATHSICRWPQGVVLCHNLGIHDNSL